MIGGKLVTLKVKPMTTGFSGTNDSKRLLPLKICQQDLKPLARTNAEVLMYLLEVRNKAMVLLRDNYQSLPLLASPYADDLSDALVYLDAAHCRGTVSFFFFFFGGSTSNLGHRVIHSEPASKISTKCSLDHRADRNAGSEAAS